MILIILGLILWVGAHNWKRLMPEHRAKYGDKGKALVALALAVSIIFMIWGYRTWDGAVYWGRTPALTGINNLLMVVAFYIYATGAPGPGKPRAKLGRKLRHPQLIGFSLWAVAHLLVNGDTPSFLLFGGLLAWALSSMVLINVTQPEWEPAPDGGTRKEVVAMVATIVLIVVIGGIHAILGYNPFG